MYICTNPICPFFLLKFTLPVEKKFPRKMLTTSKTMLDHCKSCGNTETPPHITPSRVATPAGDNPTQTQQLQLKLNYHTWKCHATELCRAIYI